MAANPAAAAGAQVARVVDGWKEHFAARGMTRGDSDHYAEQIDRQFLREQSSELRE